MGRGAVPTPNAPQPGAVPLEFKVNNFFYANQPNAYSKQITDRISWRGGPPSRKEAIVAVPRDTVGSTVACGWEGRVRVQL